MATMRKQVIWKRKSPEPLPVSGRACVMMETLNILDAMHPA